MLALTSSSVFGRHAGFAFGFWERPSAARSASDRPGGSGGGAAASGAALGSAAAAALAAWMRARWEPPSARTRGRRA